MAKGALGRAAAISNLKKQGVNQNTFRQAVDVFGAAYSSDKALKIAAEKMGVSIDQAKSWMSGGGGGGGSTSAVVNTPTTPTGMTGSSSSVVGVPTTSPTLAEQRPSPTLAEQRRISRIMGLYS